MEENDGLKEFNDLISEVTKNRSGYKILLLKSNEFLESLNSLVPKETDYRNKNLYNSIANEKTKSAMEVIKTQMDIRKNIEASAKTEFELRKKVKDIETSKTKQDDTEVNIEKLADSIMDKINIVR